MEHRREYLIKHGGQEHRVSVERRGDELVIEHSDEVYIVTAESTAAPRRRPDVESGPAAGAAGNAPQAGRSAVKSAGGGAPAAGPASGAGAASGAGVVSAPMTGTIKEVLVAEGDSVTEGERLIVMEAMKMDLDVSAPSSGTVVRVHVQAGATVREREALLQIE